MSPCERERAEKVRRAEVEEAGNQARVIARETTSVRMEMAGLRKIPKTMRAVNLEITLSNTPENVGVCEMRVVRCAVYSASGFGPLGFLWTCCFDEWVWLAGLRTSNAVLQVATTRCIMRHAASYDDSRIGCAGHAVDGTYDVLNSFFSQYSRSQQGHTKRATAVVRSGVRGPMWTPTSQAWVEAVRGVWVWRGRLCLSFWSSE